MCIAATWKNFLKTLVYSNKKCQAETQAGGGGGAHLASQASSVETTRPSHAHAASPRPLARTTRTRNETATDFPVGVS